MNFKKTIAFTLAEVLVVLGILGITAAITVPNLKNDMDDRKIVSAVRKAYAEVDAIYQAIVESYGRPVEWNVASTTSQANMTKQMGDYFAEFANTVKDCGTGTGCFGTDSEFNADTNYRKFLMKDGASLAIWVRGMEELENVTSSDEHYCKGFMGYLYIDVNGLNGDNQIGYDTFGFDFCYGNGIVPYGDSNSVMKDLEYSTAWVIKAGNRDYIKCPDDLNWVSKRTCK